jgi:nucleoside-diphosphate-sugar epimerase
LSRWHVIFGTGPLGIALMRALRADGLPVRMLNRSGHVPFDKDMETQVGGVDAANPAHAREACEGAAAVYHCAGLPYSGWDQLPAIADGIAEGAAHAGAPLVYADNCYLYGPVAGPMHESLPAAATTRKGRIRAQIARRLLDLHQAGRVLVAIGRGSDFFGAHATGNAVMGSRVFGRAVDGRAAQLVGNPERLHSYTWLGDFARALKTMALSEQAHGRAWHVPSAAAVSSREFVSMVYRAAGRPPKIAAAPRFMLKLAGRFNPDIAELVEMLYQFEEDFVVDSGEFERAFGIAPTPLEQAVRETLEWFRMQPKAGPDMSRRVWERQRRA